MTGPQTARRTLLRDGDVVPVSARLHQDEPMSGSKRKRLTLKAGG